MSNTELYDFQGHEVRVIMHGDARWFVAADVCKALGLANSSAAISRLDDDERGLHRMQTASGLRQVSIIAESGFYSLIFTSRKPEAKVFQDWVFEELLPTLRQTGSYDFNEIVKVTN